MKTQLPNSRLQLKSEFGLLATASCGRDRNQNVNRSKNIKFRGAAASKFFAALVTGAVHIHG